MTDWRNLMPTACTSCAEFGVCHGGCRALVEIRQGDPLIGCPIVAHINHAETIQLYEKSRPVLKCLMQPESFGYSLIRGHTLVQVTPEAEPLLA